MTTVQKIYHLADEGWLTSALASVATNTKFQIVLTGEDAIKIVGVIHTTMNAIPWQQFPLLSKQFQEDLKSDLLHVAGIPISPETLVFLFGSIGSLGGALGSVVYLLTLANAHKMHVSFKTNLFFDVKSTEFVISVD